MGKNDQLFSSRFKPFRAQLAIIESPARFQAICTGRRFGKTICAAHKIIKRCYEEPGDYAWIGPTYAVTERGIDAINALVNPYAFTIKGRPPVLTMQNGGRIFFSSADTDDPKSILGHGFKGIIIDEAARIHPDAWSVVIRPTIAQTMGWASLFSTPKGRNWFFDMHMRGKDPEQKDYEAFNFPSISNPHFPREEYDEARRTLPDIVFRQEYLAEFLSSGGGVFRNVDDCIDDRRDYVPPFYMGVDLAKHQDWTVICVIDSRGTVVEMDRFQHIDWPVQRERIETMWDKYKCEVAVDSTQHDSVYDDLVYAGVNVFPVHFTSQRKSEIIQRLMRKMESNEVRWHSEYQVLTNELKQYEYEMTPTGMVRYSAPKGAHDDCVIALGLAVHCQANPANLNYFVG